MRIQVDLERCDLHGQCVLAAPDLFEFDENDELVWKEEPDSSQEADARTAMELCPVLAITLED